MTEDWGTVEWNPVARPRKPIFGKMTLSVSRIIFAPHAAETLDVSKAYTVEVRSGDHAIKFCGVPVIEVEGEFGFALDRAKSVITDPEGCTYEWAGAE